MAPQLRASEALAEDGGSIFSTYIGGPQPPITTIPGTPTFSSGIYGHLHKCDAHTCTQAHTPPHKIKMN